MTFFPRISCAFLCLVLINCGGDDGNSATVTIDSGRAGDGTLDSHLQRILSATGSPAIAAFAMKDNQIVDLGAVGLRSTAAGVEVTTDDMWHIGSVTKSMTATLTGFIVDDGLLHWDSTVLDIFPEWEGVILPQYFGVSVSQLLSHTSGLEDDWAEPVYLDFDPTLSGPEQRYTGIQLALSYDHQRDEGSHLYSNLNYMIVGAMLEKVTAQDWRTLINNRLFAPLGMDNTGFELPGTPGELDQPKGHSPSANGEYVEQDYVHDLVFEPAGLVHLSLSSMAKYADFHLRGLRGEGSELSDDTYAALYTPAAGTNYAAGWYVSRNRIMHNGTNGHWYAQLEIDAERNTSIFAVSNGFSASYTEPSVSQTIALLKRRLNTQ